MQLTNIGIRWLPYIVVNIKLSAWCNSQCQQSNIQDKLYNI